MPKYKCCVVNCNSDQRKCIQKYPWMKNVTFHSFPHARHRRAERRKWCNLVKRKDFIPNRESRVCSLHFVGGTGPSKAHPDPTLFPYNNWKLVTKERSTHSITKRTTISQKSAASDLPPTCRPMLLSPLPKHEIYPYVVGECEVQSSNSSCVNVSADIAIPNPGDHQYSCCNLPRHSPKQTNNLTHAGTQTSLCMKQLDEIIQHNVSEHNLASSVKYLTDKLNNKGLLIKECVLDIILQNDSQVRKYTGLPNKDVLCGLFQMLEDGAKKLKYWTGTESINTRNYQLTNSKLKPGPERKLSLFHEYLLTLLRLRLSVTVSFLADLFNICESSVSSIFFTWISYLYICLKPLLVFPSRQKIDELMPKCFKLKYPKTRVIIDCTELFIEKPRKSPSAQATTYSQYKSHNTFKFLVGITPNGAFSFVSELWGGNVSDRHITVQSGLLDLLDPGDNIMADRGFIIRDCVTKIGCTLNIPPFTRKCKYGKGKRLNVSEIVETKSVAKLRIHVERSIERLRRFKLVNNTMPLSLKPIAQQIVTVAAVFCNFLPPLVK